MNEKLSPLRQSAEKYKKAVADLGGLENLSGQLQSEAKAILSHLSDLPAEILALPQGGADHFPAATSQKLRSLSSVRTKLELLPGVKAKQQRELEELRQQLRGGGKSVLNHYRETAQAKMEKAEAEVVSFLLPYHSGNDDRAKVAAEKAMRATNPWEVGTTPTRGCEACKWYETFANFDPATDPLENAETIMGLAEAFDRNEPCD
jgi:cell division septum initiation protein DivIVA